MKNREPFEFVTPDDFPDLKEPEKTIVAGKVNECVNQDKVHFNWIQKSHDRSNESYRTKLDEYRSFIEDIRDRANIFLDKINEY